MDPSIARAVFTSTLLRSDADAPEVRRDDALLFTKSLLRTMNICISPNIKVRTAVITANEELSMPWVFFFLWLT